MKQFQIVLLNSTRVPEAVDFIIKCINEEIESETSFTELKSFFDETCEFNDILNYESVYSGNKRVYYLLLADNKIIGQGAVAKTDDKIAELRRLYVSKEYRKTRASYSLIKKLIDHCFKSGVELIRAEIFSKEKKSDVVKLCFNKGCYEISAYKKSSSDLFVEFDLKPYL